MNIFIVQRHKHMYTNIFVDWIEVKLNLAISFSNMDCKSSTYINFEEHA